MFFAPFQLGPNVTIGRHATVGAGVRVRESMVLEGAVLKVSKITGTCALYIQG